MKPRFSVLLLATLALACTGSPPTVEPIVPGAKAIRTETTFGLTYVVATDISAKPAKIWALLTDAAGYRTWNTTVKSLTGQISVGHKIELVSNISADRTFTLEVVELIRDRRMVWADGTAGIFKGVRTYSLTPQNNGQTRFTMTENLRGAMVPLIAGALPDFRTSFDDFARDLKAAAEHEE